MAAAIGRRDLDQRYVQRQDAVGEETFNLVEEDRDGVGASCLHRASRVGGDKNGVVPAVRGVFGFAVRRRAEVDAVQDLHAAQQQYALTERLNQGLRGSGRHVDEHALSALEHTESRFRGRLLLFVNVTPFGHGSSETHAITRRHPVATRQGGEGVRHKSGHRRDSLAKCREAGRTGTPGTGRCCGAAWQAAADWQSANCHAQARRRR